MSKPTTDDEGPDPSGDAAGLNSTAEPAGSATTGKRLHSKPWGDDASRVEDVIDSL